MSHLFLDTQAVLASGLVTIKAWRRQDGLEFSTEEIQPLGSATSLWSPCQDLRNFKEDDPKEVQTQDLQKAFSEIQSLRS